MLVYQRVNSLLNQAFWGSDGGEKREIPVIPTRPSAKDPGDTRFPQWVPRCYILLRCRCRPPGRLDPVMGLEEEKLEMSYPLYYSVPDDICIISVQYNNICLISVYPFANAHHATFSKGCRHIFNLFRTVAI